MNNARGGFWAALFIALAPLLFLCGCSGLLPTSLPSGPQAPVAIVAPSSTIRLNQSVRFSATQDNVQVPGGRWGVIGGSSNGTIDDTGLYTSPSVVPAPNSVDVVYMLKDANYTGQISIINSIPSIQAVTPKIIQQVTSPLTVAGRGFVAGSLILVNGTPVTTTYTDSSHLATELTLPQSSNTTLQITVANPAPGANTSNSIAVPVSFPSSLITTSAPSSTIRPNQSMRFSATQDGVPMLRGTWEVLGGSSKGVIDNTGLYTSPSAVPAPNGVDVVYVVDAATYTSHISVLNPAPSIQAVAPKVVAQLTSPITISGQGFVAGSFVLANNAPVATTYIDSSHLAAELKLLQSSNATTLQITVANPEPGAVTSNAVTVPISFPSAPIAISVSSSTIRLNQSIKFLALQDSVPVMGGHWGVIGGSSNGTIDDTGLYTSPSVVPAANGVDVVYVLKDTTYTSKISILNPVPSIQAVSPTIIQQVTSPLTVAGEGFVAGSLILVNAVPTATLYIDSSHLSTDLKLTQASNTTLQIAVVNPAPGSVTSNAVALPVSFPSFSVTPSVLKGGAVTITVSDVNVPSGATMTLDGKALTTIKQSATSMMASGYLPPWKSGSAVVGVVPARGGAALSEQKVPIAATAVTFEAAARFLTQVGFGPRPDLVEHVQQIGFDAFLTEQMNEPPIDYPRDGHTPHQYLHYATEGNSVLKLRLAWALQSFIATQGIFVQQSTDPIERKFEKDSLGNFRKLLTDVTSDPSIGLLLNLVGNAASADPSVHPNQNFARELMQLFTLGPMLLNDDGTPKLDAAGLQVPTYDQATVLDLSRALTGWGLAVPVDDYYTAFGVDWSQPLAADDGLHDHGAKVLFGTVHLPAGQTALQDRDAALDAIFSQPSLPPFISRILIQRLVKSGPSPAYVQRIATVFEDDGKGIRGNLAAVVRAIVLDKEARAGDTTPSPDDGFLQDPLMFETFAKSVSESYAIDDQFRYYPVNLGEPFWYAPTVFAYFSPSYMIPGTEINSPEFQIFNNILAIQRSDALWGIVNGGPGFSPNDSAWLYTNFRDVPSIVEATNHLLYYGRMTAEQKMAIVDYCNSLDPSDPRQQLRSAVFLALNSDSYNVSH